MPSATDEITDKYLACSALRQARSTPASWRQTRLPHIIISSHRRKSFFGLVSSKKHRSLALLEMTNLVHSHVTKHSLFGLTWFATDPHASAEFKASRGFRRALAW